MRPYKKVLVRPPFQDWENNNLFSQGTSFDQVYLAAFRKWKEKALDIGVEVNTWDKGSLENCDLLWLLDFPKTKREFKRIRNQLKYDTPIVLQILESPLLTPVSFVKKNQKYVDTVVSYEGLNNLNAPDYSYKLPNSNLRKLERIPFSSKRGLLMLYSNRTSGFFANRQPGLSGIPFVGALLSGWSISFSEVIDTYRKDLYCVRRSFAVKCEKDYCDFVDIYGKGWNQENISWFPFFNRHSYKCWRGISDLSKIELGFHYKFLLAYENYKGDKGYISEKLFDAYRCGAVPVYLGDQNIQESIPTDSFIDARDYGSEVQLLRALKEMPEHEWLNYYEAGQRFLNSNLFVEYGDDFYSDKMTEILMDVFSKDELK